MSSISHFAGCDSVYLALRGHFGFFGSASSRPFSSGTQAIAHAVSGCKGFTLAGGGDTIAAIEKYHVADRIDYISTAGGAFLEYVEGKELPAQAAPS